jgi:hypothetical protein
VAFQPPPSFASKALPSTQGEEERVALCGESQKQINWRA